MDDKKYRIDKKQLDMTQKDKETLKWLLVETKAVVDTDSTNPYVGIFLNNLCDVVDEFIAVKMDNSQN